MSSKITSPLGTPEFARLLHDASRHPMLRRELTAEHIPPGFVADDVWTMLLEVQSGQGFFTPYLVLSNSKKPEFLTVPASMQASLSRIASLTQRGAELDVLVSEYQDRRFFTQQYIDEILANLRYDGFPADHEAVRATLVGDRTPSGVTETLALNFHTLMNDLGSYEGRTIDPELIKELYARLHEGIPDDVTPLIEPTSPIQNFPGEYGGPDTTLESLLDVESQLARGKLTEPEMHPILLSMLLNCFFWHFFPFPRFNNFLGCTISRLFMYQKGYPSFRYVPKACLYSDWVKGNAAHLVSYRFEDAPVSSARYDDYTVYYDSILKLMLAGVESEIADLRRRKDSDTAALAAIGMLDDLNPRQAEVLHDAVLRPDTEFGIRAHQRRFGVVYSTARKDLADLAEKGLLTLGYKASAYVYYVSPQLKAHLVALTRQ